MAVLKFKDSSGNWVNVLGGGVDVNEFYTKEEANAQFASITHAEKHAIGGEDEVTPASIGAYTQEEVDDMLQEKQNVINGLEKQLQSRPNPNLLDNWYFGNPVNQRGVTSYTGEGMRVGYRTIDRWRGAVRHPDVNVDSENGYITLTVNGTDWNNFTQVFEHDLPTNTMLTGSVLTDTGLYSLTALYTGSNQPKLVIDNAWSVYFGKTTYNNQTCFQFNIYGDRTQTGKSINVIACKLELGSQQTLAHQDENGNWVLNEIPDFGEQLRRCQRYFRRFPAWYCVGSQQAGNAIFRYPLNPPMRAVPTIAMQYPGDLDAALHNGSGNITPSSVTLDWNNSCDAIGFFFRGATGDAFTCTRYVDVNADL